MKVEFISRYFEDLRPDDIPPMDDLLAWFKEVSRPSLETQEKILSKLDILIDISPLGIIATGLAFAAYGAARKNSTILERGLGIAAAGLVLLNVDNPAQFVVEGAVETETLGREDA